MIFSVHGYPLSLLYTLRISTLNALRLAVSVKGTHLAYKKQPKIIQVELASNEVFIFFLFWQLRKVWIPQVTHTKVDEYLLFPHLRAICQVVRHALSVRSAAWEGKWHREHLIFLFKYTFFFSFLFNCNPFILSIGRQTKDRNNYENSV